MEVKLTGQTNLRHKLALFNHALSYFGTSDLSALSETIKREKETYDSDGKSYFFNVLKGLNLKISEEVLENYDQNIKSYLDHINKQRADKIQLKYFQYLAVLFTEIFLDNVFARSNDFIKELNDFVANENKEKKKNYPEFSKDDLSKLAYWMATGSGKTLVMHINWLQFHKYNKKDVDNILLITPNEGLSRQHLEELRKSSIPAKIFNETDRSENTIQVIEIHKLTEEKKGEGLSVEVGSFEGNNLVFVDEGHKGFSGKAWKGLRDKISEIGFTFEYSATFDEAIGSGRDDLTDEYSKSIIMDYSYAHFYRDGFGKEFTVLNLRNTEYDRHKDLILLANMMSFYQQMIFYEENKQKLGEFFFERPLWIFVGNSVSSQKGDKFDDDTVSDLQFIVTFFNRYLTNRKEFVGIIDDIVNDRNPLKGRDLEFSFGKSLAFIKNKKLTAEEMYDDILQTVFHSDTGGKLELSSISSANGEVGLRVSGATNYFGLVFIGDVTSFKKKLEEKHGLVLREDKFSDSFFNTINDQESPINVLMGSKKFIEGWNSFRVSTMGLLNMGRSKGSQIIQLFGRGVRLRGYKNLMKRSKALIDEQVLERKNVSTDIGYLETLNIFGIKADYVDTFKNQLEEEGISETETLEIGIRKNRDFLNRHLITIRQKEEEEFQEPLTLEFASSMPTIRLDLRPKFELFESTETEANSGQIEEKVIPVHQYADYFDWDKIFFELYDFKRQKELYNLHFDKQTLRKIIDQKNYRVIFDKTFDADTFGQMQFIESLCARILKKYVLGFYNTHKRKWVTDNLEYAVLKDDDENFQDYKIFVDRKENRLLEEIRKLLQDSDKMYREDRKEISSIIFDRHLYQPLMVYNWRMTVAPPGLNAGEEKFVMDLKEYLHDHRNDGRIKDSEFYLLRNLSRKGIGFFAETNNFYPDFILWCVDEKKQRIAFIDPKGLVYGPEEKKAKIEVRKTLKEIEKKLKRDDVELTSFIVAVESSSFDTIKGGLGFETKKEFEDNHVVFQEDDDYVDKIMSKIMTPSVAESS